MDFPEGFTWDPEKRLRALRKHKVDFHDVVNIFKGPVIDEVDTAHSDDEVRYRAVGRWGERVYVVIYAERGTERRIITAWRASKEEARVYFAEWMGVREIFEFERSTMKTTGRVTSSDDDDDLPATKAIDWFGAAKVMRPMDPRPPHGPTVFHVFRASPSSGCFTITAGADAGCLPGNPEGQDWLLFKRIPETGQPRVGFSEAEAKADIEKYGYHLVWVDVQTLERIDPVAKAS